MRSTQLKPTRRIIDQPLWLFHKSSNLPDVIKTNVGFVLSSPERNVAELGSTKPRRNR